MALPLRPLVSVPISEDHGDVHSGESKDDVEKGVVVLDPVLLVVLCVVVDVVVVFIVVV